MEALRADHLDLDRSTSTTPPRAGERATARTVLLVVGTLVVLALIAGGVLLAGREDSAIDSSSNETLTADSDAESSGDAMSKETAGSSGEPIPTFTAQLRGGGTLDSSDITGPAMVQVYASWCPSCQAHAPDVATVQEEFAGDLRAYYVNVEDEAGPAADFLEEYGWADAEVLIDDDRSIAGAFGLTGQPHTIFIDADGNVAEVLPGGGSLEQLRAGAEQVTGA